MDDTDIRLLKERNVRVEADKAWETSMTRRLFIASVTYVIAAAYMHFIGLSDPFLGAFVPTGGYLLSTVTMPVLKTFWKTKIYNKRQKS